MRTWQQHYYTWSTKSLSQNKVGLGIVAASVKDRSTILIAEDAASKSGALREDDSITVERFFYSEELPGYIRTGATSCEQAADQRNNKFVHVYSLKTEEDLKPEEYLAPLPFQRKWDGEDTLSSFQVKDSNNSALHILEEQGLRDRLPELFYRIYHAMLGQEKPLSVMQAALPVKNFSEWSGKMMILIHSMLPKTLRKEADYVSYVNHDTQEAHILFRNEPGKYGFSMDSAAKIHYEYLEERYFTTLSEIFLKNDGTFERWMEELDEFLDQLNDRRNQLKKWISYKMLPGETVHSEEFFTAFDQFMYWAKKDDRLHLTVKETMKQLDYYKMSNENLLRYTKVLMTGAGGRTKSLVLPKLYEILTDYFQKKDNRFHDVLSEVRKQNGHVYVELLRTYLKKPFVKAVLYERLEKFSQLREYYSLHQPLFDVEPVRTHFVEQAFSLYENETKEEVRNEIEGMAKTADKEKFIELKWKKVEEVLKQAENLSSYLYLAFQMKVDQLEEIIRGRICQQLIGFIEKTEKVSRKQEEEIKELSSLLKKEEEITQALKQYYQKYYKVKFQKTDLYSLYEMVSREPDGSELLEEVKLQKMAKRYEALLSKWEKEQSVPEVDTWIGFVVILTERYQKYDKKASTRIIKETKKWILGKEDKELLNQVNRVLKEHGAPAIPGEKKRKKGAGIKVDMKTDGFFNRVLEDISGMTIFAYLFGFYGFLFVTLRETLKFLPGYQLSIGVLILLVILYGIFVITGQKKWGTGAVVYVLGVGIFLMNLGISLDTAGSIYALYIVSGVISVILRIVYTFFFGNEKEEEL